MAQKGNFFLVQVETKLNAMLLNKLNPDNFK